jgi:hypothetical protein
LAKAAIVTAANAARPIANPFLSAAPAVHSSFKQNVGAALLIQLFDDHAKRVSQQTGIRSIHLLFELPEGSVADKVAQGGEHLHRGTQVRAVPGSPQGNKLALGQISQEVVANLNRHGYVVRALQQQGRQV